MAKIEIDNKKMWASLMEQCALSDNPSVMEFYYLIRRALKKQGFDINSETNEIVSIEPESQRMKSAKAKEALLPYGELSEFEKGVKKWLGFNSTQPNDEDLKMIRKAAEELLSIARKQIADDIDVDAMVDDYDTSYMKSSALSEIAHEHYRQGIEETLNKIK